MHQGPTSRRAIVDTITYQERYDQERLVNWDSIFPRASRKVSRGALLSWKCQHSMNVNLSRLSQHQIR